MNFHDNFANMAQCIRHMSCIPSGHSNSGNHLAILHGIEPVIGLTHARFHIAAPSVIIITSLLRHYYAIITSLLCHYYQLEMMNIPLFCVMQRVSSYYYIITTSYYIITTNIPMFTNYYIFSSPKLADV